MAWFIISREGYQTESVVNDKDTALMLSKASSEDTPGVKLVVMEASTKRTVAEYINGKQVYVSAEQ